MDKTSRKEFGIFAQQTGRINLFQTSDNRRICQTNRNGKQVAFSEEIIRNVNQLGLLHMMHLEKVK